MQSFRDQRHGLRCFAGEFRCSRAAVSTSASSCFAFAGAIRGGAGTSFPASSSLNPRCSASVECCPSSPQRSAFSSTLLAFARVSVSPLPSRVSYRLLRSIALIVHLLVINNLAYLYPTIDVGVPSSCLLSARDLLIELVPKRYAHVARRPAGGRAGDEIRGPLTARWPLASSATFWMGVQCAGADRYRAAYKGHESRTSPKTGVGLLFEVVAPTGLVRSDADLCDWGAWVRAGAGPNRLRQRRLSLGTLGHGLG
ncbi:hypothetical protein MESS2_1670047 [Mesorhizobium metallidurans STM 2683]|uniref:Uncharacterized protein n=2 Tax=Mesorhizobium TaxID=68287 RepID=M5ENV5_9HYPH|nr:conserved hypothetical protein [Mesorhizobium ventifaucium]CCV05818.1 hypothetical protein MESS2_1670047 [Mesorhizobium metallidurans STM 2683]